MNEKVLFANISYRLNGKQQGSFRYVLETGDAMEKSNFDPVLHNGKEICLGFFEAGFTKGGYENGNARQVHIEKIDIAARNSVSTSGVTVIWCALIPDIGHTSVIGWYKDAEVFRIPITIPYGEIPGRGDSFFGYQYNVISDKQNCVLLPYTEIVKSEWRAPRQRTTGFGFGQSNMWYAQEPRAKKYVDTILNKIMEYKGINMI